MPCDTRQIPSVSPLTEQGVKKKKKFFEIPLSPRFHFLILSVNHTRKMKIFSYSHNFFIKQAGHPNDCMNASHFIHVFWSHVDWEENFINKSDLEGGRDKQKRCNIISIAFPKQIFPSRFYFHLDLSFRIFVWREFCQGSKRPSFCY